MSSINTNSSAMTALKTLNMTNKSLETTQNRISTGYRVASASDNSAYWSIATTMRSDNKSMSTVQDALGLGSATVDVAYTAMDAVRGTLDDIKTKIVAAKQPGIDKSKLQGEISQLQDQLKTYASSATFSGSNWLSVNSDSTDYSSTAQVVSSFTRDSGGNLSIGTVDINVGKTALFDAGAADGLLEGGTSASLSSAAFAYTQGNMDAGGKFTFSIAVDGGTAQDIDVAVADAAAGITLDDVVSSLNSNLTGATASKSEDGTKLVLTSATTGTGSSVEITGVAAKVNAGTASTATIGITTAAAVTGEATGGGVLDIDITANGANLDAFINSVDSMAENVTSAAADLGAVKSRIGSQQDFVSSLMDAVDRGVGQLVDADMSEESTKLQALQTQQQLGIQALSIANSSSQSILSLFR